MSELVPASGGEPIDRDGIIAAIRATPIVRSIKSVDIPALNRYMQDPQTATKKYQRSLQRSRQLDKVIIAVGIAGANIFFFSAMIAIILSMTESDIFTVLLSTGLLMVGGSFVTWMFNNPAGSDTYAINFLDKNHKRYLPVIERTISPEGVTVSLSDYTRTFEQRTFGPDDIAAALEYQVELEAILEEVREERTEEFVQTCLTQAMEPVQTKSLPPAPVISEDIRDLEALLAEQEQAVVSR